MISIREAQPKTKSEATFLGNQIARQLLGVALPACLALANALFWYSPTRNTLMGWGDDPSLICGCTNTIGQRSLTLVLLFF